MKLFAVQFLLALLFRFMASKMYISDLIRHHPTDEQLVRLKSVGWPTLDALPNATNFNCTSKTFSGFYADTATGCQVFHRCNAGHRNSYLCPKTTVFNQLTLVCDYVYNVDCSRTFPSWSRMIDMNASEEFENFANSRLYSNLPLFDTRPTAKSSTSAIIKKGFASASRMAEQKFKDAGVIPDVIKRAPSAVLDVKYASGVQADLGKELKPREVKDQPEVRWTAEDKDYYTLAMTDPDAPSRQTPKAREWQHWLVVNIPGNKVNKGQVLTEYVGAGPPQGTGKHRYVLLAYKQPGKIEPTEKHLSNRSGDDRPQFKIQSFAEKYKMGDPVAGNFFEAEWDDYVPELYKQLAGDKK